MSERLPPFVKFGYSCTSHDWHSQPTNLPTDEELADKFEKALNSAKKEEDVQDFLERYPHILPGLDTYHHGPIANVIVTKMPLGNDFITDFAFVSENSQSAQMTCIEIESPHKPIFLRNGSFSREYLNARQQLFDWNFWAQQNLRDAMRLFGPLRRCMPDRRNFLDLTLRCILITGRRSHIHTRKQQERWAAENALRTASMTIMTFDRVLERVKAGWYWPLTHRLLVCSYGDREFQVKRVAV
jgi:hypothetical protein